MGWRRRQDAAHIVFCAPCPRGRFIEYTEGCIASNRGITRVFLEFICDGRDKRKMALSQAKSPLSAMNRLNFIGKCWGGIQLPDRGTRPSNRSKRSGKHRRAVPKAARNPE